MYNCRSGCCNCHGANVNCIVIFASCNKDFFLFVLWMMSSKRIFGELLPIQHREWECWQAFDIVKGDIGTCCTCWCSPCYYCIIVAGTFGIIESSTSVVSCCHWEQCCNYNCHNWEQDFNSWFRYGHWEQGVNNLSFSIWHPPTQYYSPACMSSIPDVAVQKLKQ